MYMNLPACIDVCHMRAEPEEVRRGNDNFRSRVKHQFYALYQNLAHVK